MELSELRILFLKGVGAIEEDGLKGQALALEQLVKELSKIQVSITDKIRVEDARETAGLRLSKDHVSWGVHMTHCYSPEDEWDAPCCKYGEDDICPAAMYENPYKAYCEHEAKKNS